MTLRPATRSAAPRAPPPVSRSNVRAPRSELVEHVPERIVADIARRPLRSLDCARAWCGGRGGSIHLSWPEYGMVGQQCDRRRLSPIRHRFCLGERRSASGQISITYIGDGTVHIGSVQEAMNLAALWDLPICFFVENNQYAVATTVEESTRETRLSARGWAWDARLPRRRYGSLSRVPADAARARRTAGRSRTHPRGSGCVPVLPPERTARRQQLPLS